VQQRKRKHPLPINDLATLLINQLTPPLVKYQTPLLPFVVDLLYNSCTQVVQQIVVMEFGLKRANAVNNLKSFVVIIKREAD